MRKHRTIQFIATLILIAALFYLAFGVISAVLIGRVEPGPGWGPGWHGWATLPILFSSLCGGLVLLVFGAVLFFLARIDSNLSLARKRRGETAPSMPSEIGPVGAATAAPGIVTEAPQPKAPIIEAEVEAPPVLPDSAQLVGELTAPKLELPEVALPKIEAELPKADLPKVDLTAPSIEAALPDVELSKVELPDVDLPKVDLTAPMFEAALPDVELPKVELPDVDLPKVDLTAPTLEAALPDITLPKVELPDVDLPKVDLTAPTFEAALPDVELPKIELPDVELPKVELPDVELPKVELPDLDLSDVDLTAPTLEAALPDIALPKVELPDVELPKVELPDLDLPDVDLTAPTLEAELPDVIAPQAPTDDVAALRTQLAALQARLAALEAPAPAAALTAAPGISEEILAGAEARLPGSDEVARIAAEMAALRPPKNRPSVTPQPLASLTSAPAAEDDLEVIQGIGPAYAQRLRVLGITTFAALAEASEEVLGQVAGRFADRVRSEDWRGQARQLLKRS